MVNMKIAQSFNIINAVSWDMETLPVYDTAPVLEKPTWNRVNWV